MNTATVTAPLEDRLAQARAYADTLDSLRRGTAYRTSPSTRTPSMTRSASTWLAMLGHCPERARRRALHDHTMSLLDALSVKFGHVTGRQDIPLLRVISGAGRGGLRIHPSTFHGVNHRVDLVGVRMPLLGIEFERLPELLEALVQRTPVTMALRGRWTLRADHAPVRRCSTVTVHGPRGRVTRTTLPWRA